MGMLVGSRGSVAADPNVVPLIDILLVLLVIFMIIPHHQTGLDAMLPQPAGPETKAPPPEAVIVQVREDGSLKINEESVSWDRLSPRLEEVFKQRAQRIAFIRGDAPVEFATVARVVDVMRQLDLSVGLLTPKLEQSR
ncbi:MAG TPA: biopolymer transporter ExbD [Candidatus Sulfotelmatobacter sp.]|jgi:biopolymer transport protein TolR|nr:biopolymer transporter ExbD [Candidatus Sulfotelmatobacter sp.]